MKILLIITLIIAGCARPPEPAQDVQFSAILTMSDAGTSADYRVNFRRDMQRVEAITGDMIIIIRRDKGLAWTVMPNLSVYTETRIRPEYDNPLMHVPGDISSYKKLGEDSYEGHPVLRESMEFTNGTYGDLKAYRWFATDLGWPIKAEAEDGSWKLSYTGIKPGPQDAALFQPPPGMKRMK